MREVPYFCVTVIQILSSKTVTSGTHKSVFILPTFTFLHMSVCSGAVMPRLTSFVLRPNILSQAGKFLRTTLKMSQELLTSVEQKLTLEHPVEFRKQRDPDEAEKS